MQGRSGPRGSVSLRDSPALDFPERWWHTVPRASLRAATDLNEHRQRDSETSERSVHRASINLYARRLVHIQL